MQKSKEGTEYYRPKTYYEILGVSQTATGEEIKAAFRRRAKETHPDKPGNKYKEEEFKDVNEAYQILSDSAKRRIYDQGFGGTATQSSGSQPNEKVDPKYRREETGRGSGFASAQQENKTSADRDAELERLRRQKERLEEELNRLKNQKFKNQTQSEQAQDFRQQPSYRNPRSEQPISGSNLKIKKSSLYFYLVDDEGNDVSTGYNKIESRGNFIIGSSSIFEYLLDPRTGQEISHGYNKILLKGAILIGKSSVSEYLLDPRTGQQMSQGYNEILIRDGLLIGKSSIFEYLIDKKSGNQISSGYKVIIKKGNKVFGKNSLESQNEDEIA